MLGGDFEKFKKDYDEKSPAFKENLSRLNELIENNCIRREKGDVLSLPEKEYRVVKVEMAEVQKQIYRQLKEELYLEISNIDGEIIVDEIEGILKKLLRLSQVASNPYLIDKSYSETPAKYLCLDKFVYEIVEKNEKVIIWTSFVDNIHLLKNRYSKFSPLVIYGEVPIKDRALYVDKFQNVEKNKVLIANPMAAREGLTLTRANNAIYLDRNFNLVDYLQSQDRIHRISQEKKCFIYKLICTDTIDEYIERLLEYKHNVAKYIQGDKDSDIDYSMDFLSSKSELLKSLGG